MQGSIAAAEPELTQQLGHLPTDQETAEALGTDAGEVAEATSVRGCFNTLSLDAPAAADNGARLVALRFCAGLTQEEIGNELGVSQMQVSRLLRGILDRLRKELAQETH
jgi:RNA polymerase sigma-B factor